MCRRFDPGPVHLRPRRKIAGFRLARSASIEAASVGPTFKIHVYRKQQLAFAGEVGGTLELGRQQRG